MIDSRNRRLHVWSRPDN